MIYDSIKNRAQYFAISDRIATVLEFLSKADLSDVEPGTYEIDSDNIFYSLQKYSTKTDGTRIEGHRKYIDIQYMVKGREYIGVAPIETVCEDTEYSNENDMVFFSGSAANLPMTEGMFMILFPWDAHEPKIAISESEQVIKVVAKVKI